MAILARNGRKNLWFGTLDRMEWLPTPNRGADVSSRGWEAGGNLLSGGAYQFGSFDSAKFYTFEWPSSSSREVAQLVESYASGTYGRGLIYFVDPLTYTTNVLPSRWADPSMTVGLEANPLIPGLAPTALPAASLPGLNLPVKSAFYDLTNIGATTPEILDDSNSVFIPIPDGFYLALGAVYSYAGTARIRYSRVAAGGAVSGNTTVNPVTLNLLNTPITPNPGEIGIRLWVGKTGSAAATITLTAMMAQLFETGTAIQQPTSWIGGQGNSGVRFSAKPTRVNMTGVNGGQVQFAASFTEVGSWVLG